MNQFPSVEEEVIYKILLKKLEIEDNSLADLPVAESVISERFADLERNIDVMNAVRQNHAFRHLYSCRKAIGGLIVFVKRAVRKCLKWYIEPICFQQTDFNNATTLAVDRLRELQRDVINIIDEQNQQIAEQNKQISELRTIFSNLESKFLTMADEKAASEKQNQKMLAEVKDEINIMTQTTRSNSDRLDIITLEHNGRLDIVENDIKVLKNGADITNQGLNTALVQLDKLREQGAFDYIVKNAPTIRRSASQAGEDGIIAYVMQTLGIAGDKCTYLDLGANHAKHLSNTYYFYQLGAKGVLVEANPALIPELMLYRSGDVILNKCLSSSGGEQVPFYVMNGDGLSTPDKAGAEAAILENNNLCIVETVNVETVTANDLLDTYFDKAPMFLNIDIEGKEQEILKSIDFAKHRPLVICIEVIPYRKHLVVGEKNQDVIDFMQQQDYVEYAFTGINSIFLDKRQLKEVLA